jgi:hypothetical protein
MSGMAVSAMRRGAILALPATGETPVGRTGKMPVPRYSAASSALAARALVVVYRMSFANVPSRLGAEAAGQREVCRWLS